MLEIDIADLPENWHKCAQLYVQRITSNLPKKSNIYGTMLNSDASPYLAKLHRFFEKKSLLIAFEKLIFNVWDHSRSAFEKRQID
jgi:hypothetical protein